MRAFLGHIYFHHGKKLMHFIICVCVCFFALFTWFRHFVHCPHCFTGLRQTSIFVTAINWIQRNVCVRANGQMFVCSTKRKNLHTVLSEMETLYLFIFHSFFQLSFVVCHLLRCFEFSQLFYSFLTSCCFLYSILQNVLKFDACVSIKCTE